MVGSCRVSGAAGQRSQWRRVLAILAFEIEKGWWDPPSGSYATPKGFELICIPLCYITVGGGGTGIPAHPEVYRPK